MRAAVIGAGGWGTAISILLAERGHDVTLWARSPERAAELRSSRENKRYLPGIDIPKEIQVVSEDRELTAKELYIFATPSQMLREVASRLKAHIASSSALYMSASKGIERNSLLRMTEVAGEVLGVDKKRLLAFSGPSHAEEVARRIPTLVVTAGEDQKATEFVQDAFLLPYFRVYSSTDVVGVELAGALKNVIAICAGILEGEGYGDNTVAALVTRGLAEMKRLGIALGADGETFAGIAGLGDLVVTCLSKHSRNRYVGEAIGKGKKLDEIVSGMTMIAEGVTTTQSAKALAAKSNVEMPIVEETYKILFENKDHRAATTDLMMRSAKDERL
jgi:glycerol-3-phosphate dehydrogenase (NAD(P)+)